MSKHSTNPAKNQVQPNPFSFRKVPLVSDHSGIPLPRSAQFHSSPPIIHPFVYLSIYYYKHKNTHTIKRAIIIRVLFPFSPRRLSPGLRSGEITPNSLNTSRPGSAMSSSTTASGVVYRRSLPQSAGLQRKPRPASIAVTGVSAGPKEGLSLLTHTST